MGIDKFALFILYTGLYICDCCIYGDGPSCRFPCRCETGECDPVNGTCLTSKCANAKPSNTDFDIGWTGDGCRIGNVAYEKPTSGNLQNLEIIVDGKIHHENCRHEKINTNDKRAILHLDLGSKHTIEKIIIFNTANETIEAVDVLIGMNTSMKDAVTCKHLENTTNSQISIQCDAGQIRGQYIFIRRVISGDLTTMTLCEIVVVGYETIECPDNTCNGTCNELTGCKTCMDRQPPDCSECTSGTYGENCSQTCGHCVTYPCNLFDGRCADGCKPGYKGDTCQSQCKYGTWGHNCSESCGICKLGYLNCIITNGTCIGGCSLGYYGIRCADKCGNCLIGICNEDDGKCEGGCMPGYEGEQCISNCSAGKWGDNCKNDCGQCRNKQKCDNVNGRCPSDCDPGYKGEMCFDKCDSGYWGNDCNTTCGHCRDGDMCDHITGTCANGCAPGYTFATCSQTCYLGYWGNNCENTCGKCAFDSNCNYVNGTCSNGCEDWFLNDKCDTEIPKPYMVRNGLQIKAKSSSEMVITWEQYCPPDSNLGKYYIYHVQYTSNVTNTSLERPHKLSAKSNSVVVSGLLYNTDYNVQVIPYRTQNNKTDPGNRTDDVTERTLCKAPTAPDLIVINDWDSWLITFTGINDIEIGCDKITSYSFNIGYFERDKVLYTEAILEKANATLAYRPLYNGTAIWLKIVNNQGLKNTSIADSLYYIAEGFQSEGHKTLTKGETTGVIIGLLILVGVIVGAVLYVNRHAIKKLRTETNVNKLRTETEGNKPTQTLFEVEENTDNSDEEYEYVNNKKDELRLPTTCVAIAQLGEYIKFKNTETGSFEKEYTSIKLTSTDATFTKANEPEVSSKNRYKNIKAYDHTRVVLECEDGESSMDYINACFIPGYNGDERKYIAGQGPMLHTTADTWRMIWQCDINRVVMVTNLNEMGKTKCQRYWPENVGEITQYGELRVKLEAVEEYSNYTIRQLTCSMSECSPKSVVQLHFTTWPDKDVVEAAFPLLMFRHKVHSFNDIATGPLFVHCSAGVGRTGTYIAIDYLIDQGLAEGKLDVHQCVTFLREHRMNMVQTTEQYKFIHEVLHDAFTFGDSNIACTDIIHKVKDLQSSQEVTNQFKAIDEWQTSKTTVDKTQSGQLSENANKNRDSSIIPSDSYRPFLKTKWSGGNDYINAVYVNTYRKRKAIIVTQFPLANTIVDFWRLVYDHRCEDIFMLGTCGEGQQEENVYYNIESSKSRGYWPNHQSKCESYGPICVTAENENLKGDIISREFNVEHKDDAFRVKHTQVADWLDGQLPDMKLFMNIISQLHTILEAQRENPILIQCCNGAAKSGVLVAALFMIERMKIDQEVDIVNAVRSVKTFRQRFIHNQDQFEFLYKVASSHQDMFSIYENAT